MTRALRATVYSTLEKVISRSRPLAHDGDGALVVAEGYGAVLHLTGRVLCMQCYDHRSNNFR